MVYAPLTELSDKIPLSLSSFYKVINLHGIKYEKYVVCPACSSVYENSHCIKHKANGTAESKNCTHVFFPNHPQRSRRKPCSHVLLKKVRTKRSYIFRPIKTYPYRPLRLSIEQLIKRNNSFLDDCEKWRTREVPNGYLCDIHDGLMWKEFNSDKGYNFVTSPHCYLLTLNVDWFQPFNRSVYSVGAIYLTIQNLPRHLRYRIENMIVIGIIPGPDEPKKNINSFLGPLVVELQEAWQSGFVIQLKNYSVCIKLALTCIACDIPATRKVCGFLSHNAELGCNKCLKKFVSGFRTPTDYSGFDMEDYTLRSQEQHRRDVANILNETTKTAQQRAESKYGLRYSVLLDLMYFDPIKFVSIDVMHNLYLGSAKHCFELWIEEDILSRRDIKTIGSKMRLFHLPAEVGRIPSNISSCHGSFTADQWKNWILIYSPIVLKDVMPHDHLQCWLLFVHACRIITCNCIKQTDVDTADLFLKQFCCKFQMLYGNFRCTMNMHLHMHLKEIFKYFGPPHATWCYPFERFNGILGSYHTNKRDIETQIMKKFCQAQEIYKIDFPTDDAFCSLLPEQKYDEINSLYLLQMAQGPLYNIKSYSCKGNIIPLPPCYEGILTDQQFDWLKKIYMQLYSGTEHEVSQFYQKCGRVRIAGNLIGSDMPGPHNKSSVVITAFWLRKGDDLKLIDNRRMQVGIIQFFVVHNLTFMINNEKVRHIWAYVHWKQSHRNRDYFGRSAIVCEESVEECSACCFIPVQRIACRCAYATMPVQFEDITETVFIACPIQMKYSI